MKEYKCPKCNKTFKGEVSFCPHCGTKLSFLADPAKEIIEKPINEEAEDNTRFNAQFKKSLIFELIGNISVFLLAILLLFVPFFVNIVDLGGIPFPAYFSFFDSALWFMKNVGGNPMVFSAYIFELMLSIYFIIAIVVFLVFTIKSIINLSNLKSYYLLRYDNLINRVEEPRFRSRRYGYDSFGFLISAIILFIFCMVFDKMPYVGKRLYDGVNGMIALPILFFVAAMTFSIMKMAVNSKVKKKLLEEKYNKSK